MKKILVTVDTNIVNVDGKQKIRLAIAGLDIDIAETTISNREQGKIASKESLKEVAVWGESQWGNAKFSGPLPEPLTIGESQIGLSRISDSGDLFEKLLTVMWSGSFPKPGEREDLDDKQKNKLRDSLMLTTHVNVARNIFVSNDLRAFGQDESDKRKQLESLCSTRIMSLKQFVDYCEFLRRQADQL